jgi:isoleucyl-tRNA synthetase
VAPREQPRDTGVSDETWTQLQADIRANELAQKNSQDAIVDLEQQLETAVTEQEGHAQEEKPLQEAAPSQTISDDDDDEENERKRRHEELRIRALKARHAKQEAEEKLRKAREEADRKRKEEAQAQKKLRDMGVCPVGFRWIKQRTGYRCAGGSHFVSNSELGA